MKQLDEEEIKFMTELTREITKDMSKDGEKLFENLLDLSRKYHIVCNVVTHYDHQDIPRIFGIDTRGIFLGKLDKITGKTYQIKYIYSIDEKVKVYSLNREKWVNLIVEHIDKLIERMRRFTEERFCDTHTARMKMHKLLTLYEEVFKDEDGEGEKRERNADLCQD